MEPILSVRELTKTFSLPGQGKQTAINGVSFDLRPGEITVATEVTAVFTAV